ncbi:DUF3127 domain-containing protein [Riemerella anatipestifer]|nr:DUF3127 domain-containing protein [Riemerella anatipestifer]
MELIGIFKKASDVKSYENGFKVQEFYLDNEQYNSNTGEVYSNLIKLQLIKEKIDLIKQFKEGDRIKVYFNIKGQVFTKEDNTKGHVQNLNVWKIEAIQNRQPTPTPPPAPQQNTKIEDEDDDLPF